MKRSLKLLALLSALSFVNVACGDEEPVKKPQTAQPTVQPTPDPFLNNNTGTVTDPSLTDPTLTNPDPSLLDKIKSMFGMGDSTGGTSGTGMFASLMEKLKALFGANG